MSDIDYAARVARGIALMDEKWPNWATEVDLEALNVMDASRCVTAQYAASRGECRDFLTGQQMLSLDEDSYIAHGFNAERGDAHEYVTLNDLWKAEILRRRAQAEQAPAEPEASA